MRRPVERSWRAEFLVKTGDLYRKVLVDESARILRRAPQLSVVLCVPLRGTRSNSVWLLRLDISEGRLESLLGLRLPARAIRIRLRAPRAEGNESPRNPQRVSEDCTCSRFRIRSAARTRNQGSAAAGSERSPMATLSSTSKPAGARRSFTERSQITRPLASSINQWSWFTDVSWQCRSPVTTATESW